MKKSLTVSICMLALAVLTLCGVTFAYFNAGNSGSVNSVQIGEFAFDSQTDLSQTGEYPFRAATILNVPEVTDGTPGGAEYDREHALFLTDGDDKNFNAYCVPVTLTVTNKSRTDMNLQISVRADVQNGFGKDKPRLIKSFVFGKDDSAALLGTGEDAAQTGKYAERIRILCAPDPGEALTGSAQEITEARLLAGQAKTDAELKKTRLTGVDTTGAVTAEGRVTLLAVVWLDYREYKTVTDADRTGGTLKIGVTVRASNQFAA